MKYSFKCLECGDERLEEVMADVWAAIRIADYNELKKTLDLLEE